MELPDSIKAIGDQLAKGDDIRPAPELFEAYDVFAAELAHVFSQPWLAVDHASRLAADGDFFRAEIGSRSVVLVREKGDRIHAMRNACLHAGYRVCEEESGHGEHLFCQYHGWYYALDGRLTDPMMRPDLQDRSRYRLPRYAMQIQRGLILVDLSAVAPEPPPAGAVELGAIPAELAEATVTRRQRYPTTWNWKRLRQFLWAWPSLPFAASECEAAVQLGPLSFVSIQDGMAALVRLAPRFPGHTDIEVIEMALPGTPPRPGAAANDPITAALRQNDRIAAAPLDRGFFDWYWTQLSSGAAN